MVISTSGPDGQPEAAVVEFGETDDLELIFDTFTTSRKYKNLKTNPKVACVIGWDDDITVQYEGVAEEVRGDEAKRWDKEEEITYFKITPTWIRYSDLTKHPWDIKNVTF